MTIRVVGAFDDGLLTNEHPASSYGMPVLIVDGVAHGPGDMLSCGCGEETWREPAKSAVRRARIDFPPYPVSDKLVWIHDDLLGDIEISEEPSESAVAEWQRTNREMSALRDKFCK